MREWLDRLQSTDVTVLVQAAWRWWVAELLSMVPLAWRGALRLRRSRIVIDVLDHIVVFGRLDDGVYSEILRQPRGEIGNQTAGLLLKQRGGQSDAKGRVLLRLPVRHILRRRLTLPDAAQKSLGQLLAHEVERQSPLDVRHIYHDYRVMARDKMAQRIEVELGMTKRDEVDQAVVLSRSLGFDPESLAFIEDDPHVPPFRLPRTSLAGRRFRLGTVLSVALVGLPIVLVVVMSGVAVVRDMKEMDILAAKVASAKSQAQAVDGLRRDLVRMQEKAEFVPRQKQIPLTVKVLAEVTRLLPDGSWLFGFELNGRELRIHGYSPAASSLVALFDAAPLFVNARFRSPLTPGPRSDLERFDLSCDLRGGPQ